MLSLSILVYHSQAQEPATPSVHPVEPVPQQGDEEKDDSADGEEKEKDTVLSRIDALRAKYDQETYDKALEDVRGARITARQALAAATTAADGKPTSSAEWVAKKRARYALDKAISDERHQYLDTHLFVGPTIQFTSVRLTKAIATVVADDPATADTDESVTDDSKDAEGNQIYDADVDILSAGAGATVMWMPCKPYHVCVASVGVPFILSASDIGGEEQSFLLSTGLQVGFLDNLINLGFMYDLVKAGADRGSSSGLLVDAFDGTRQSTSVENLSLIVSLTLNEKQILGAK